MRPIRLGRNQAEAGLPVSVRCTPCAQHCGARWVTDTALRRRFGCADAASCTAVASAQLSCLVTTRATEHDAAHCRAGSPEANAAAQSDSLARARNPTWASSLVPIGGSVTTTRYLGASQPHPGHISAQDAGRILRFRRHTLAADRAVTCASWNRCFRLRSECASKEEFLATVARATTPDTY